MSLRDRLTLVQLILVGAILVFVSVIAYTAITVLLYNYVDDLLARTADQIVTEIQVSSEGELGRLPELSLELTANVYVQVRDRDRELVSSSPGIASMMEPLDPVGLELPHPVYRESTVDSIHLRVLTVPLVSGTRDVGKLQVAASLNVVDTARGDLLSVLAFMTMLSVIVAGLASRWTLGRELAPLRVITDAADQVNRADDLSRRIPYDGDPENEIGQLVTAFNQTFERLEVLFTSQQRFIADVSHELRTPLTVIKGNVDLMRRMRSLDEESLTSIDQEASRMTRMVTDLLLLAKAEAGQLPLTKSNIELDALLLEVFQEMRVLARSKVHIKVNEIDQIQLYADRDRLKQVLLNLIANAIQYTPQGGEVFLSLARVGEQARLIVRDTGPGIPSEDLPYIFERFYRAEKSRTRASTGGFGLGLSIAHWIVDQHGGRIEVRSQEGKGTTFAIWLPLTVEPQKVNG
ncbi:MAG: HAMP domain-containing sensor histidine kinase [Chloroflexota bacterium]